MAILYILLGSLLLCFFIHILSSITWRLRHPNHSRKLPPGPGGLSIIANLPMLGSLPHRALANLAQKYGPIMSIRLGHVLTVVVSSPSAAELFLKTHDLVFASRPKLQASKHMTYNFKGIILTEYGAYWRYVRKLCTVKLLSGMKVESFAPIRNEKVSSMVEWLRTVENEVVDLSEKVKQVVEEIAFKIIFGSDIFEGVDLKGLARESVRLAGAFNVADYVPYLEPLDLQRLRRRMRKNSKAIDEILNKVINDRLQQYKERKGDDNKRTNFVDVLLSELTEAMNPPDLGEQEPNYTIELTNMKAIACDMVAAAFNTTSSTIEWTLSELLRHPQTISCLQQELNDIVGIERMVEESDLPKLAYLNMVIKESFRLHPVAPFLIPREAMEDIEINGYFIPKKTRVVVNVWAIGRDPNVWSENWEEFYPERFIGSNVEIGGHDFKFTPFGFGRRGCPGKSLGLRTVSFVVAQLVHCFNWKLPPGMQPGDLDMTEKFGPVVPRANHLLAVPTYRLMPMA
ncbi:hypothetical protein UlMin_037382 [Ulmus minor]